MIKKGKIMRHEIMKLPVFLIFVFAMLLSPKISAQVDGILYVKSVRATDDGSQPPETKEGTGFVISENGYVITANHVVFEDEVGYVTSTTGAFSSRTNHSYPLTLVYSDQKLDLALFVLPSNIDREIRPLRFGHSSQSRVGDTLITYGFPEDLDLTLSQGLLSARSGRNAGQWRTTIGFNPGQSGGPVINSKGEVVAIAAAGDTDRQLVTYVIPEAHAALLRLMASSYSAAASTDQVSILPIVAAKFDFTAAINEGEDFARPQRFCLQEEYKIRAAYQDIQNSDMAGPVLRIARGAPNCVDAVFVRGENSGDEKQFMTTKISLVGEKSEATSMAAHGLIANNGDLTVEELPIQGILR
jgi:hypothetical protein